MPKRITIEPHLSLKELERRYRYAKDPIEARHYQIIWLLASGKTAKEVAQLTSCSRSWVYELVWGYNRLGPEALGDKRQENLGTQPLLDDVQQVQLWQALRVNPPDGGVWNGRKVADWMSKVLNRPVSPQRGWEYLRMMRYKLRPPRPKEDAELADPEELKKKLARIVQTIRLQLADGSVVMQNKNEYFKLIGERTGCYFDPQVVA